MFSSGRGGGGELKNRKINSNKNWEKENNKHTFWMKRKIKETSLWEMIFIFFNKIMNKWVDD